MSFDFIQTLIGSLKDFVGVTSELKKILGQHIHIKQTLEGMEITRSYTPVTNFSGFVLTLRREATL